MKRLLIQTLVIAGLLLLSANARGSEGRVTEKGSGKPVVGAFVIAKWSGQAPHPVGAATICLHAEVAVSDEQGRFKISQTSGNFDPLITRRHRSVGVYKPGYQVTEESRLEDLKFVLEPSTGTRAERFARTERRRAPFGCDLPDSEMLPFLKARAAELNSLASTPEELRQLSNSLFTVEKIEFGEAEAMKRSAARRRERESAPQLVK